MRFRFGSNRTSCLPLLKGLSRTFEYCFIFPPTPIILFRLLSPLLYGGGGGGGAGVMVVKEEEVGASEEGKKGSDLLAMSQGFFLFISVFRIKNCIGLSYYRLIGSN